MSCLTAIILYKTVVLPRGLYGAELWDRLTKEELRKLVRVIIFV